LSRKIIITQSDKNRLRKLIENSLNSTAGGNEYIHNLDAELNQAVIVPSEKIPNDVISMNSKFILSIGDAGEDTAYSLVYPSDADISSNKISVLAPIGTAVLGYREGDTIEWNVPDGAVEIKVKKVVYQPESAGDYDL